MCVCFVRRIQCASRLRRLRSQSTTVPYHPYYYISLLTHYDHCHSCSDAFNALSYGRMRADCEEFVLPSHWPLSSPYITYPTCLPTHPTNIHIKLQLSLIPTHNQHSHQTAPFIEWHTRRCCRGRAPLSTVCQSFDCWENRAATDALPILNKTK